MYMVLSLKSITAMYRFRQSSIYHALRGTALAQNRCFVVTPMGSLGWARCWWCWRLEYNMYIPDPCQRPLCGHCSDRFYYGGEPPWWPNHRQRTEMLVEKLFNRAAFGSEFHLPENVCQRIASYNAIFGWP